MIEGVPFKKFMEHLIQEIIRADAEMQLLQRNGWTTLNQGFPLVEGMDHLEFLGLNEVRLTFQVEPIKLGFWGRLKRCFRYLFGKPEAAARLYYRLAAPGGMVNTTGFLITVTVSRDRGGNYKAVSEPAADQLENVYVSSLFA